jgi:hypothetical protein
MGLAHSPSIVTSGLVLCLDAANRKSYPGSGTTWKDLSGNGNTGTLTNGPTFDSANGGSLVFDGVNDHVPLLSSVNAKTVIAFIKLSASGGDYVVYGLDANGSDNWLGVNANKIRFLGTQIADVNNFSLNGTSTLSTSIWYQIACTIDVSTAKVYFNGFEENSVTQAFTIGAWNTAPTIGRRGGIDQRYFPGNISNLQIYNRVLSAAEIAQNFQALRGRYSI